ncbi:hypothetical protein AB4099_08710 [Bosea sp. 2KB_26]|uniref:hypothetical protein n=1 Tax=Bosea sp. 2KB_26 TaxID=3237475 RepID=UPI003F932FED
MSTATFQPRVLAALAAALGALFAASLLLTGAGGLNTPGNAFGANSYSRSAVGHLAVFELVQALGHKAVRGEHQPLAMLGSNGVLVLAEPSGNLSGEDDRNKVLSAKTILLVLPKWSVRGDERRRDWIGAVELAPVLRAQAVLSAVANGGEIVRVAPPASSQPNIASVAPTVHGQMQLIKGSKLKPLIASSDGILLGELQEGTRRIWILSDPDPLENHGIGKDRNADFVRDIVAALLGGQNGTLVFDETIHGFQRSPPNLLKFLYEFPFNLALLQFIAGLALLLFAAMGRFGAAQTLPRQVEAGRHALIGNAASLIDHAGHHAAILHRYIGLALQDAARILHAPPRLAGPELVAWLGKTAAERGIDTTSLETLERAAKARPRDLASLLTAAQTIHRWRKDLVNGIPQRLGDH